MEKIRLKVIFMEYTPQEYSPKESNPPTLIDRCQTIPLNLLKNQSKYPDYRWIVLYDICIIGKMD